MSEAVTSIVKSVVRGVALLLVTPALLLYWLKAGVIGRDRALEGSSQALALLPGLPGRYMRQAFLARVLAHCDKTAVVEFGTTFSQTAARLEERVYIGPHCHLGLVHIEAYVMLGAAVEIPSGAHTHQHASGDEMIQLQPLNRQLVRIGKGAWLGSGAIVMADVGAGTIVGAGSVVTRPLPENVVAAGVPARVLRPR